MADGLDVDAMPEGLVPSSIASTAGGLKAKLPPKLPANCQQADPDEPAAPAKSLILQVEPKGVEPSTS
jgi:hypothetical protein